MPVRFVTLCLCALLLVGAAACDEDDSGDVNVQLTQPDPGIRAPQGTAVFEFKGVLPATGR